MNAVLNYGSPIYKDKTLRLVQRENIELVILAPGRCTGFTQKFSLKGKLQPESIKAALISHYVLDSSFRWSDVPPSKLGGFTGKGASPPNLWTGPLSSPQQAEGYPAVV